MCLNMSLTSHPAQYGAAGYTAALFVSCMFLFLSSSAVSFKAFHAFTDEALNFDLLVMS